MQRGIVLAVAVLAFGLFCYYCVNVHAPMIQDDISARVQSVLDANHIPTKGMSVDGRDVLLTGPAGSVQVAEATRSLVAATEGVRTADVRITDAAPDASTVVPALTGPAATPPPAQVETQGKLDALLEQDVVEFNPGSADLTQHGRDVLDQVAPLLAGAPAVFCEIQGHTDSVGNAESNNALSYRRAIATKNYLVNKGIAPERLTTKGLGDTQPVASNDTAEGRRKNRRIKFVLKEKP